MSNREGYGLRLDAPHGIPFRVVSGSAPPIDWFRVSVLPRRPWRPGACVVHCMHARGQHALHTGTNIRDKKKSKRNSNTKQGSLNGPFTAFRSSNDLNKWRRWCTTAANKVPYHELGAASAKQAAAQEYVHMAKAQFASMGVVDDIPFPAGVGGESLASLSSHVAGKLGGTASP